MKWENERGKAVSAYTLLSRSRYRSDQDKDKLSGLRTVLKEHKFATVDFENVESFPLLEKAVM